MTLDIQEAIAEVRKVVAIADRVDGGPLVMGVGRFLPRG
jgi:hypothetical protein